MYSTKSPWNILISLLRVAMLVTAGWFLLLWVENRNTGIPTAFKLVKKDFQQNDTAAAQSHINGYLAAHSTSARAFQYASLLCLNYNHPCMAADYARQGLRQCSNISGSSRARLYLLLSQALYSQGPAMVQQAEAAAQQAITLAPNSPDALNQAGYILAATSTSPTEIEEGLNNIRRALTLATHPFMLSSEQISQAQIASYEDSYGWALYRLSIYGQPQQAANTLSQAVAALNQAVSDLPVHSPDHTSTSIMYYHLALAAMHANHRGLAQSAAQTALFYNASSRRARKLLADIAKHNDSPQPPTPAAHLANMPQPAPAGTFTLLKLPSLKAAAFSKVTHSISAANATPPSP